RRAAGDRVRRVLDRRVALNRGDHAARDPRPRHRYLLCAGVSRVLGPHADGGGGGAHRRRGDVLADRGAGGGDGGGRRPAALAKRRTRPRQRPRRKSMSAAFTWSALWRSRAATP